MLSSEGHEPIAIVRVSRMQSRPPMILNTGLRLVMVAAAVTDKIEKFSCHPENAREAGGILVGSYRGPHIEITECSQPLPRDRRSPTLFDRSDPGHHQLASKRWLESGRTSTFVGEWHTHPESLPTPSRIDINTWQKVSRKNTAGGTVFLIRGYDGWWAGLSTGKVLLRLAIVSAEGERQSPTAS
jgi:integrative and conjugative element protein (TIGR02256 family)